MKKLVLLIAVFFAASYIQAQINVTQNDLPKAGVIYLVGIDTNSNTNIGTASPTTQTWNFSTLVNNYPKIASYSSTAPYQCYAPSFPGSNLYTYGPAYMYSNLHGSTPIDLFSALLGYGFWKKDASGFSIVGFRSDYGKGMTNTLENPQELLMGTPATYGSNFPNASRWSVKLDVNPGDIDTTYAVNVHKSLDVDAFGSLTTVYGTYDVLRVHEYMTEVDSAIATLGGTTVFGLELGRDTVNNYYFWANGKGYPIASVFADKNNIVLRTEFLTDTLPGFSITGNVFKTDSVTPVLSGNAQLIAKSPIDQLFGVPETVEISNGGHFQFANVAGGNFLVLTNADTGSYPHLISTYYGDTIHWQGAIAINAISDTDITVNMRNDSTLSLLTGNSFIHGCIWADTSVQKAAPTHERGVKITIEQNPGGSCYRHTFTDNEGNFAFTNLPAVDFTLSVEIGGLTQVSTYNFPLSVEDSTYLFKDFIFDSTEIRTYVNPVGITENILNPEYCIHISPNPFVDYTTISIESPANTDKNYSMIIYDILGNQVRVFSDIHARQFVISRDRLRSGMYFYEIRNQKETIGTGKIIVQ